MPGAMSSERQQTGVIVASPDYLQSIIAQGVREGLRMAVADTNSNRSGFGKLDRELRWT